MIVAFYWLSDFFFYFYGNSLRSELLYIDHWPVLMQGTGLRHNGKMCSVENGTEQNFYAGWILRLILRLSALFSQMVLLFLL